jgi:hypothetical protein
MSIRAPTGSGLEFMRRSDMARYVDGFVVPAFRQIELAGRRDLAEAPLRSPLRSIRSLGTRVVT